MSIEVGLLIALIGCIVTVTKLLIDQRGASAKDGERWGRLEATLERHGERWSRLEAKLDKVVDDFKRVDAERAKEFDESLRRLHDRIDEHIQLYHGVPPAGGNR